MRKWMSERLKRRKKPQPTQPSEPAHAPLQPAYFDAHEPQAAEAPEHHEPESAVVPEPREAVRTRVAETSKEKDAGAGDPARRRRRRARGGRGRGGARSDPAKLAPAPAAETPEHLPRTGVPQPTPTDQIPTAPTRPPKGAVILAIGLPGSGKSSWFKRNNVTPLSSDMLRMLLFDDAQEQRFQDLVFSNLRSMLKARLISRRPLNYVDATNLTPQERHSWIKLAKDYGYEVQAVFFDVPIEVCLERNRRRERAVDEDVMRRMAAKLKPPTFEEGFSKVTVVRVKKKDSEAAR
jgi:predicted kinase